MLDALLKRETAPGATDLSDVTAVVVRYFGGILLGAGGLVRAYSESVSAALDRAPLVQRRRLRICTVAVPHTAAGRLENDLRAAGYVMAETSYEAETTVLRLALPDDPAGLARAAERLAALSAGTRRIAARRNGVDRCPPRLSRSRPAVSLVDVTEAVLEQLLSVAIQDADADEVTPPLGSAAGWNSERISWFREYHHAAARTRRAGAAEKLGDQFRR